MTRNREGRPAALPPPRHLADARRAIRLPTAAPATPRRAGNRALGAGNRAGPRREP